MPEETVIVTDQPIGTISPRLYGHFAEHLGRCWPLLVESRRDGFITTALPPHSMATIEFSSLGAGRI